MEYKRKSELTTARGPAEYFTGEVTITGQFQRAEPSRVGGAIVHFEPGARTAWHKHPLGQTLIVTDGIEWTQVDGGKILEFHAGDQLWCPADQKHWHGATPTHGMTHIAIQESLNGSPRDLDGACHRRAISRWPRKTIIPPERQRINHEVFHVHFP